MPVTRNAWVVKFGRRGNSNGIAIPRAATRALRWRIGDIVILTVQDGQVHLTPFRQASPVALSSPGGGYPQQLQHAEK